MGGNSVDLRTGCKHGCNINGLIKSFINQEDEHINVVADVHNVMYSRFSGFDTVGCSAKGNNIRVNNDQMVTHCMVTSAWGRLEQRNGHQYCFHD